MKQESDIGMLRGAEKDTEKVNKDNKKERAGYRTLGDPEREPY